MKTLANKLIPDHLKKDPLRHSHAKNLIGSALIASLAAPVYAFIYYCLGFPLGAYLILFLGVFIVGSTLLIKPLGSIFLVRKLIVTAFFLCISWLSYYLGGLSSPVIFWFCLPPLMAIFYGGIRSGLIWSCICLIAVLSFFWLAYLHLPLPASPITDPELLQLLSLSGLILVILGLVYFFEIGKREAAQETIFTNIRLGHAIEEAEDGAKKAEIANRLKTEFLVKMSHELRTPLNSIIGLTEIINSGKAGAVSAEQKEYLGDVLTSAQHLLQLINDTLDLSRIESGKMTFNPEPVNLTLLCNEVAEGLSVLIRQKHIEFTVEIDASLRHIIIDPLKFKQIVYNFLSNAIKFTPESGKIQIKLYPCDGDQFKLEVKDSGIGIHERDIKKLFVEFQQLEASLSKKYQGTGLGLALTQSLVKAQGGYVGVESRFGKGSTFFAILPCTPRN